MRSQGNGLFCFVRKRMRLFAGVKSGKVGDGHHSGGPQQGVGARPLQGFHGAGCIAVEGFMGRIINAPGQQQGHQLGMHGFVQQFLTVQQAYLGEGCGSVFPGAGGKQLRHRLMVDHRHNR